LIWAENFFSQILAPKKKNHPKYQIEMAASMEELKAMMQSMAKQFTGFQDMMSTTLDKLGVLETWQTTADAYPAQAVVRDGDTSGGDDDSGHQARVPPTTTTVSPAASLESAFCLWLRGDSTSTALQERCQAWHLLNLPHP
jgi:hypothetical protein